MGAYKTKYFGDLEVDELNDEILVETHIENNGEDVPVSIIIRNFSENADKMDEITAVLDCYFAMHEAAKAYIEKHYPEHEGIVNYLFRYAGDVLKKEYRSKRGKVFTLDLESMIRRLDPPSVSLPHYKDGKIRAEITYYCPDVDNGQLSISIDKDCKIYHSEFNDYR
ncbi:MAG: hypothetical protein LBH51_09195 [Treponema sp.]|nr:hypothetical protein [Treponema sp.]